MVPGVESPELVTENLQHQVNLFLELHYAAKSAHWNQQGSGFASIHPFIDKIVKKSLDWADAAAERLRAYGHYVRVPQNHGENLLDRVETSERAARLLADKIGDVVGQLTPYAKSENEDIGWQSDLQGYLSKLIWFQWFLDSAAGEVATAELETARVHKDATVFAAGRGSDYENPGFSEITQHTVTNDGRVFGHLGIAGLPHSGIGKPIAQPDGGYREYARATRLQDGTDVEVFPLLMGPGHSRTARESKQAAADKAEFIIADVAVGYDDFGVWYAGRLRETYRGEPVTDDVRRQFAASTLSGEWINNQLTSAVAVALPGYAIPNSDVVTAELEIANFQIEIAREFSAEERERLAEEGAALPDGSFPIVTRQDLINAVRSVGRARDVAAARRHIVRRAAALDLENLLPENWRDD